MAGKAETDTLAVLIHHGDFYGRDIPGLAETICVCAECFFEDVRRANFALKRALSSSRSPLFLERGENGQSLPKGESLPHRCSVCGKFLIYTRAS